MTPLIMGVAESRLSHIVDVQGYSTLRQDQNIEGGGIILYVRNNLRAQLLAHSDTEGLGKPLQPDYLMCKVWSEGTPSALICLIYRPPKISFKAKPEFLNNLRDFCSSYSHKIIMGDLNADLLVNSSDSHFVNRLTDELTLQVVQHGATHRSPGTVDPKTWH